MNRLSLIFFSAYILNFIWENLHSHLYDSYRGEKITQKILIRASLFDAVFITVMSIFFVELSYLKIRLWYSLVFGFVIAVLIENHALKKNRWKYNKFMPIIPIIKSGLTPTIQLGLISYLIYTIALN